MKEKDKMDKISTYDYNAIKFEGLIYSIVFLFVLNYGKIELLYIPISLMLIWIAFPPKYIPQIKIYGYLYRYLFKSIYKSDLREINFKSEKFNNILSVFMLVLAKSIILAYSLDIFKIIIIFMTANFLLKSLTSFCFGRLMSEMAVSFIFNNKNDYLKNANCFLKKRGAMLYPRCKRCTSRALNCLGIQVSGVILVILFFSLSILFFVENQLIRIFAIFASSLVLFLTTMANNKSDDLINANFNLNEEISVRKQAEREVKKSKEELEIRVEERTKELRKANDKLNMEIIQRNQAEKQIIWQNKFLSNVIESVANPFYVVDADDYSIIISNHSENGDPGYQKCYEISHGRHSPCQGQDHTCPLQEVKSSKQPVVVEHIHLDKEGNERIFEVYGYPIFDDDGRVKQMIVNSIDITPRKHAEEAMAHLANVTEKSHDAIGSLDIDGVFTSWNKGAEEIFGYTKEEIIGKPFGFIVPEELKHQCGDYLFTASEEGFIRSVESERISKSGKRVPVEMTISALNDNNGEFIGYTFIMRDISERQKMENELLNRQKALMDLTGELKSKNIDLEKSNNLKELFIDIMGHDLLNPIGIIKTTAEFCLEDIVEKEDLELILENSQKAAVLIENAKMFSRLENSDKLEKDEMELGKIVDSTLDDLMPLLTEAGMEVENNISEPLIIMANRMIEHVFINLFTNGIKYAKDGKKIIIDAYDQKENFRISIKDYGKGIPDENKNEIFTRFKRNYKGAVKGSGLGLAIVKKLVELHCGKVWVEDNPEGGTIFCIEIPKCLQKKMEKVATGVDDR